MLYEVITKSQWRHKLLCTLRHDYMDFSTSFNVKPQQLNRFIDSDPAANPQNNFFPFEHTPSP